MKRAAFLYNPISGDGKVTQNLDIILRIYQKYGFTLELIRLDENMDLTERFREMEEFDHFVISGGDGTVNVCLNSMLKSGRNIPFGILPTGTANDFARYIGMPINNIEEAIRQMHVLPPQRMDLPMVNGSAFINVLSAGFFTDIAQKTDTELKNAIGKLAYYLKSIEMFKEMKKSHVTLRRGEEILFQGEMYMMLIFNGVSTGSIKVSGESKANDGLLDIVLINGNNIPELVPPALGILRGEPLSNIENGITYLKTDRLTVESDETIPTDVDGEKGPELPLKVICLPQKLTILGVKGS